jgi:Domain of unknown function (DUF4386)
MARFQRSPGDGRAISATTRSTGDWVTTTQRIAADQTRFRAGLVYDMVRFASVIALAWALFVMLRGVDRDRALLALLLRMAEAVVGAATVLLGVPVVLPVDSQEARARPSSPASCVPWSMCCCPNTGT